MTLDGCRIGIAAQALGIAEAAIEESVKYVAERVQFGHPLSHFQNTQFQLADMQAKVDASRLLILRAAQSKQDNEHTAIWRLWPSCSQPRRPATSPAAACS
jgi:butyryl-CoA dehydrogenase